MVNISRAVFNTKVKAVEDAPTVCKCTNCKKEININDLYLRFTGESLHVDCLFEYMQKLNILDVIAPQKNEDKNDSEY